MELKCFSIEQKVSGSYHESQYNMIYLNTSRTVKAKSFKAEVNIIYNRYLHGKTDRWNATYISGEIIKAYNNMSKDGTWKREIDEKDQIIPLSTKVAEIQAKLKNQVTQVVALVTQAKKEIATDLSNEGKGSGTHCSKRDHYTVAIWRLTNKEEKVCMHGKDYFWCTGDHWSGGTKHNGMYADHKTYNHDSWRTCMDECCKTPNDGQSKEAAPSKSATGPSQKLALNDKLCNAFCTQAGLSAEAIKQIWQDAQGNK
jgi:hypothetical protein